MHLSTSNSFLLNYLNVLNVCVNMPGKASRIMATYSGLNEVRQARIRGFGLRLRLLAALTVANASFTFLPNEQNAKQPLEWHAVSWFC